MAKGGKKPPNNSNEDLFSKQLPCVEAENYPENYEEILQTDYISAFEKLPVNANILVKGEDMEERTDVKVTLIIEFHLSLLPNLSPKATTWRRADSECCEDKNALGRICMFHWLKINLSSWLIY